MYSISTGGTLPCELKYIRMPLIDHQVCQNTQTGKLYQMVSGRPYPDIQICAGFLNGTKDACQVKYRINGNKSKKKSEYNN